MTFGGLGMTELMIIGLFGLLALFALTLIFAAIVVVPARVFWRCVQLPGHWFCFGVTVLTTLAVTFVYIVMLIFVRLYKVL